MKIDPAAHHRRSIRLKDYDYTQAGAYFVTLVTHQRVALFGEVVDGVVRLSQYGKVAKTEWQWLPRHFPNIHLDAFVVMPNHIHAILVIDDANHVGATPQNQPQVISTVDTPPIPPPDGAGGSPRTPPPDGVDAAGGSPHPPAMDIAAVVARATRSDPGVSADGPRAPAEMDADGAGGSPLQDGRPNGPAPGSLGAMIGQYKSRVTKRLWRFPEFNGHPVWLRNYYEHIIRSESEYQAIVNYILANPQHWEQDRLSPSG